MDDNKLMELIRAGDCEGFIYIMEKYNKLLWLVAGAVLNSVGTSEDIEECISDAYLSLWQNPKAYDPERGSLKTFLAVIAKRRALDRYRRLIKEKVVPLDDAAYNMDETDDLFELVVGQDLQNVLFEAVALLKEPDKEILTRRYFFDEKPSVIADKMGKPLKEVENRLYQSKIRLRKTLIDMEVIDCGK